MENGQWKNIREALGASRSSLSALFQLLLQSKEECHAPLNLIEQNEEKGKPSLKDKVSVIQKFLATCIVEVKGPKENLNELQYGSACGNRDEYAPKNHKHSSSPHPGPAVGTQAKNPSPRAPYLPPGAVSSINTDSISSEFKDKPKPTATKARPDTPMKHDSPDTVKNSQERVVAPHPPKSNIALPSLGSVVNFGHDALRTDNNLIPGDIISETKASSTQDAPAIVMDFNNHRLLVIKSNTRNTQLLGSERTENEKFTRPNGVTVDDEGNIIVEDSRNVRAQTYSPANKMDKMESPVELGQYSPVYRNKDDCAFKNHRNDPHYISHKAAYDFVIIER